jgi:hypothetical protein
VRRTKSEQGGSPLKKNQRADRMHHADDEDTHGRRQAEAGIAPGVLRPRRLRRNLRPREQAPLPAERLGGIGFVFMPPDRIIAPWPNHNAITPDDQQRLLCVVDFVNAARPDGPCWIWPERGEPVLLGTCPSRYRRRATRWSP